jgi:C-terminal processing protease CtpA/Prc
VAVGNTRLTESTNLHSLLWNTVGEQVRLTVRDPEKRRDNERIVIVRPITHGQFTNLEYDRWVKEKREKVHEWSDNKLGYIHIRSMSGGPLENFEMMLYAEAHDKEGLVIDVRNNGGGWTTDYLLAMLTIENHAVTIPRDGEEGYPQGRRPVYAWTKPIIVLTNEYSFSNAEIFAHAIQTLDRGKVVGEPTGGLVISTGGIRLIDGSSFRVPFRGWYVKDDMMNMENNGAVPDIIVQDKPGDTANHVDRQLERAVKELQSDL